MCTNYTPTARVRLLAARLGLAHLPEDAWPPEVFSGFEAPIVVRGDGLGNAGGRGHSDSAPRCLLACFGLVPRWSKDAAQAKDMARRTYNARSETAAAKPSYRGPWHARARPCGQACAARGACAGSVSASVAVLRGNKAASV